MSVIIILSIGNTQISTLLLCFLYLFAEPMITMNEYILFKPMAKTGRQKEIRTKRTDIKE